MKVTVARAGVGGAPPTAPAPSPPRPPPLPNEPPALPPEPVAWAALSVPTPGRLQYGDGERIDPAPVWLPRLDTSTTPEMLIVSSAARTSGREPVADRPRPAPTVRFLNQRMQRSGALPGWRCSLQSV